MDQNSIIFLSVDQFRTIIKEVVTEVLGPTCCKPAQEGKEETFYSREELCKKYHISDTKLWRLEKDGTIHKQKFGRRNLYLRTEVDEIVASGKLAEQNHKSPKMTKNS